MHIYRIEGERERGKEGGREGGKGGKSMDQVTYNYTNTCLLYQYVTTLSLELYKYMYMCIHL